jgi:pimeloyl-ACP methyl ester carboxylesterase
MRFPIVVLLLITFSLKVMATQSELLQVDGHPLHVLKWGDWTRTDLPTLVLLSGPIDTWHSDSAWWAALGPRLAKDYRIIAVDRAGIFNQLANAPVGYQHFADDLYLLFKQLNIQQSTVVAFASSNNTVNVYFASHPHDRAISRLLMIDPDVLTPYSIARYKNDAQAFKDNLQEYLAYVAEGKYIPRVEQKNAADLASLKELAKDDKQMDWSIVDKMFAARLEIVNQLNLFREIARYGEDLDAAFEHSLPASIPLTIIDTDFEMAYIETAEDEKSKTELLQWRDDAKQYYQQQVSHSEQGRYIPVATRAHLFQVEQANEMVDIIKEFISTDTAH